jgi:hypothetical protein
VFNLEIVAALNVGVSPTAFSPLQEVHVRITLVALAVTSVAVMMTALALNGIIASNSETE